MANQQASAFSMGTWPRGAAAPPSTALDRWALERIRRAASEVPVRYQLWDGFVLGPPTAPLGSISVLSRRALYGWLLNPELNFGDGYMAGAIDVHGDLRAILEAIYRAWPESRARHWWWQSANGPGDARANVHRHYDLGNDFYRLWLDRQMVYTCAYFASPEATLDDAQLAKMDLVCRKLHLRPGERVVEAGCGWGALALFMAKRYGVSVRAFNVSAEQVAFARARAEREGLTGRVDFVEDDYRTIRGQYDVFVSVGMLEHVGLQDFPTLGRVIGRVLTPHGRGLLHFIGRNMRRPLNAWIRKRIFPGAYPPTLGEVSSRILEPHGLSVLDVENLRLHYAKTLDHWLRRFESVSSAITEMFDERFMRAWRLYLAGSGAAFATGWMQLFQVVFARGTSNAIPWTRTAS
jgi:cyclopropane-fatty-acyl-phospholipid synthase